MAHVLAGGDRLFGLMHVLYYTAVLYLHRDFLPFLPPSTWSPSQGRKSTLVIREEMTVLTVLLP